MQSSTKEAPLEDLMVAMDVVDTLRHRQQLVDRELDADARRERLIEKLRDIYSAQGIDVTDKVLADGVKALEEDRFKYTPPEKTFATQLAGLYVTRDKWLKPLVVGLALIIGLWIAYYFLSVRPEKAAHNALPDQLNHRLEEVNEITLDNDALTQAQEIHSSGTLALKNENFVQARAAVEDLELILVKLNSAYQIRIVQQQGERSGVWRIPDANTQAKNYYLVVEALDARDRTIALPITSEESGKISIVQKWGIRVDASIFNQVAADKKDDGIIQMRQIGQKKRGQLLPEYSVSTNGAAITDW